MKKRYFAFTICLAALVCAVFFVKPGAEPKLISSIVSMDTAYLTVLASKREVKDAEKFRERLLEMIREDSFREMKLWTEQRGLPQNLHISVYVTKRDLKCGSPYRIIKYENIETP